MKGLSATARRTLNRLALLTLLAVAAFYFTTSQRMTDLERIQERGTLHLLTLLGPTIYFEDGRGGNGLEYLLARDFAKSIDVELDLQVKPSINGLLFAVGGPKGDLAAANLIATEERKKKLLFSIPYDNVTPQLLYKRGTKRPKSLDDLEGSLVVIAGSSHAEKLASLKPNHPDLTWDEREDVEMSDLVRMVHDGEIVYTVVDSAAYNVNRHLFPRARRAFDLGEAQPVAWAFPKHGDGTLLKAANEFLSNYIETGKYQKLRDSLYAQAQNFSVSDSQRLNKLAKDRLPDYEPMFRQVGQKYGLDWHLLAAVAYQESHWNPKARSPTGVRGLMMLTRDTAKEMGVDRLDPAESLDGGTRYLLKLKKRLPERIQEPDRTWLTLASYNVGFGHMEDARVLAARAGKNPDKWQDVREHLPLLAKKKFYSTVKRGYARGWEPVAYVDNIQYYMAFLKLHSISNDLQRNGISGKDPEEAKEVSTPSSL